MSIEPIEIIPYTITNVKIVKYFNVEIGAVELFTRVTIKILLFNEDKELIDLKYLVLSGQEYLDWTNDDTYIINKVKHFLESQ